MMALALFMMMVMTGVDDGYANVDDDDGHGRR